MGSIERFIGDETGADLIEYALIVAVVSFAAAAVIKPMTPTLVGMLESLATKLAGVHP